MGRKNKLRRSGWDEIDGSCAFVIPMTALRHSNLVRLSPWACKLVLDLARQYTGFNNGYLCASWSLMQYQGWNSPTTLHRAIRELEHYQVLIRTMQGGRNRPNLHGFTWRSINEKPGKPLDVAPSEKPGNYWKLEQPDFELTFGDEGKLQRAATPKLREAA